MQKLLDGLKHFQHHVFWERRELFERSTQGQHPQALMITCSDSRILPDYVMQSDPGDLFVARNAGNLIPSPDVASGEAATIEYAVSALGVTDLIVCGHYRCGAVKALLQPEDASCLPSLRSWLSHAAETRNVVACECEGLSGDELWDRAVEKNVLVQLANLSKHPVVAEGVASGRLKLHAWVLRFESGEVVTFDPDTRNFVPLGAPTASRSPSPPAREMLSQDAVAPSPRPETSSKPAMWRGALWADLSASLVVFAVALPLCIAIAKASGVPTSAGIITAAIGGVVVGLLGGGELQVSGPTAGLIMIVLGLREQSPVIPLAAAGMIAGLLQLAGGYLRLGKWFRAISPAVVLGTLAGIGMSLILQQLHVTVDDPSAGDPITNLLNLPRAVIGIFQEHGHPSHFPAAATGLLTLAVLLSWKRLPLGPLGRVPAPMAALTAATAIAFLLRLPVQTVEFDSLLSGLNAIDYAQLPVWLANPAIWLAGATIALVASSESLLTAVATDQLHSGPRTRYDKELAAQGIGNLICGAAGALPMASVVIRSSANVEAGARTRLATVLHGLWMLGFAWLLPGLLKLIPTCALAAILVPTGIKLIQHRQIRQLQMRSRSEWWICMLTAATVVLGSLPTGVLVGIGLSLLKLIYTFSRLKIREHRTPQCQTVLQLEGAATFLRLPKLAAALGNIPPHETLHVDIKKLSYIDHACLELLQQWNVQQQSTGGALVLDWDILHSRFQHSRPRPVHH